MGRSVQKPHEKQVRTPGIDAMGAEEMIMEGWCQRCSVAVLGTSMSSQRDQHQRKLQVDCWRWTVTGCCWKVEFVITRVDRVVDPKFPDGDQ